MPEPTNVRVAATTPSTAAVTYSIPSSPADLRDQVEVVVRETDSNKEVQRFTRAAQENGSISIVDLTSGTPYSVQLQTIASDGRRSDLTAPVTFETSKCNFPLHLFLCDDCREC